MPSSWFHTIATRLALLTPSGVSSLSGIFSLRHRLQGPQIHTRPLSFYTISPNETIDIHASRIQMTLSGSPLPSGASQPSTFTILKSLQTLIHRFRPPSISILQSLNKRSRMSGGLELSKPHSACGLFVSVRSFFFRSVSFFLASLRRKSRLKVCKNGAGLGLKEGFFPYIRHL